MMSIDDEAAVLNPSLTHHDANTLTSDRLIMSEVVPKTYTPPMARKFPLDPKVASGLSSADPAVCRVLNL